MFRVRFENVGFKSDLARVDGTPRQLLCFTLLLMDLEPLLCVCEMVDVPSLVFRYMKALLRFRD